MKKLIIIDSGNFSKEEFVDLEDKLRDHLYDFTSINININDVDGFKYSLQKTIEVVMDMIECMPRKADKTINCQKAYLLQIVNQLYCGVNGIDESDLSKVPKDAFDLWEKLGDIHVENEEISEEFKVPGYTFEPGTSVYDIWHWFEENYGVSVAVDLMRL